MSVAACLLHVAFSGARRNFKTSDPEPTFTPIWRRSGLDGLWRYGQTTTSYDYDNRIHANEKSIRSDIMRLTCPAATLAGHKIASHFSFTLTFTQPSWAIPGPHFVESQMVRLSANGKPTTVQKSCAVIYANSCRSLEVTSV